MDVKKRIFIKSRVDSAAILNRSSTMGSSVGGLQTLNSLNTTLEPRSALSAFLMQDEDENENDFELNVPDKFNQAQHHLVISVKFYLGGK